MMPCRKVGTPGGYQDCNGRRRGYRHVVEWSIFHDIEIAVAALAGVLACSRTFGPVGCRSWFGGGFDRFAARGRVVRLARLPGQAIPLTAPLTWDLGAKPDICVRKGSAVTVRGSEDRIVWGEPAGLVVG